MHSGRRPAWRRGGQRSGGARIARQLAVPVPLGLVIGLLTYMANRLNTSFADLGCQRFGLTNPVTVTRNGAGAAIAATFTTAPQRATAALGAS